MCLTAIPAFQSLRSYSQRNGASNPYTFKNDFRHTRNPIARQTVLSTAHGSSSLQSSHPHKRQRMDPRLTPLVANPFFSGKSSRNGSSARGTVASHDLDPEIRKVSSPLSWRQQQRSFPNNAKVLNLNRAPVVRIDVDKIGHISSPDLLPISRYDFDTLPRELSRKPRKADAFNRPVSPSESNDEIGAFSSDYPYMSASKLAAILRRIVQRNQRAFGPSNASVSSRTKESLHGVPAFNFIDMPHRSTITGKMKPKDQVRMDLRLSW